MDVPPDFWHELNVRRHALFNAGGMLFLAALPFVFTANPVTENFWELWWWILGVVGGLNAVIFLLMFGPAAVRGGTLRVVVAGGVLRVDSPYRLFGPSFQLPVAEIGRLIVLIECDVGQERHAIETVAGVRHLLDATYSGRRHIPADRLFEAIHQLRPDVLVVTERN